MGKKCMTIICPKCEHTFDACFIDYGGKKLDWFAQCPKCDARFPVHK